MERVYDVLLGILIDAGYQIGSNNAESDILAALSNYEEKFNSMKEHILMQKHA